MLYQNQMIFFPSFNPFDSVLLAMIGVTRQLFVCAFAEAGRMENRGDMIFVSTDKQARDKEEDGVPEMTFWSKGGKNDQIVHLCSYIVKYILNYLDVSLIYSAPNTF